MSHERSGSWIDRRVRAAMRDETDALRATVAELATKLAEAHVALDAVRTQAVDLRATVQAIGEETGSRAAHVDAGLAALRDAIARDARTEALRLRLEGLAAQHRWDMDHLRQALTAIAERLPLTD